MGYVSNVPSGKSPGTVVSGLGGTIFGTSLVLLLLLGAAGCDGASPRPSANVTSFEPPSEAYYRSGDEAVSSLRFKNTGDAKHTFWIGYSVQDNMGRRHDVPAGSVELDAGEESKVREKSWGIPENDPPVSGTYDVKMSVWDVQPGKSGSSRLASVEENDAFTVLNFEENFDSLDRDMWNTPSKQLGLSSLLPENVDTKNGHLRLKIPAGAFDGGEIESRKLYLHGTYRARIKVADAPSSITGFFLYKEPDFENEIDIEIFNDSTGRILFTTYSGGEETNAIRKKLPFDPTADFHDYRFDLYPDKAEFYVDGELLHRFTEDLPEDPMRLYVNAWFPMWLSGQKPETDSYVYVDWLEH